MERFYLLSMNAWAKIMVLSVLHHRTWLPKAFFVLNFLIVNFLLICFLNSIISHVNPFRACFFIVLFQKRKWIYSRKQREQRINDLLRLVDSLTSLASVKRLFKSAKAGRVVRWVVSDEGFLAKGVGFPCWNNGRFVDRLRERTPRRGYWQK